MIESLPQAFEVVKEMQAGGLEWGEGCPPLGRQALAAIVEGRMTEAVDRRLDNIAGVASPHGGSDSQPTNEILASPRHSGSCPMRKRFL